MTFLNNFFARKTAPAPMKVVHAERGELAELQLSVDMRSAQLCKLQEEEAAAVNEIAEIERLGSTLKVALSEGSPSAGPSLDGLASKRLAIERRREGLGLRIGALQGELAPLVARAGKLARDREARRQDEFVLATEQRAAKQFEDLKALWLATCSAAFDLQSTVCGPAPAGLDSEHVAGFGQIRNRVEIQLQQLRLSLVNEQWIMREPGRFDLKIVPAVPARPREIAKVG